jgi:hypothetical protein
VAADRIRAVGDRGRGAIQRDGHDHDRQPGEDRQRRVRVQAVGDDVAEPAPPDQARYHDEREREHDRLVDGQQELPAGERQLDLEQRLRRRGA